MKLSIVIVNWNTGDLLRQCLRSIAANVRAWTTDEVEVFVVDNASADDSVVLARSEHPWARFIENRENAGFARANNQALSVCSGQYVMLLNPDTELLLGALQTLVAFMDTHPEAGACGPLLLNADGSLQPSCHPLLTPGREFWRLIFLDRLWPRAHYPLRRWGLETARRVEVIKGACFLLRQAALDEVGLLDDRYFMYTEEMDLCYRLLLADWELYWVPQASVVHYGGVSSAQVSEQMYVELYRSKVQFQRKFGAERRAVLMKVLLAAAYTPRWAMAKLGAVVIPHLQPRSRNYLRLLRELRNM